jgi:hypothetical protein
MAECYIASLRIWQKSFQAGTKNNGASIAYWLNPYLSMSIITLCEMSCNYCYHIIIIATRISKQAFISYYCLFLVSALEDLGYI